MPAPCPCMKYPFFQNFGSHFTISLLIKSFCIALIFSSFLFFASFGYHNPFFHSVLALIGLYLILGQKRLFWIGFFIALLWFWWIGLSFRYYHLIWMIPLVILFVAFVYGTLFWFTSFLANHLAKRIQNELVFPFTNASFLFFASSIHPFGFNWFIPEVALVHSYFGLEKSAFAIVLLALVVLHTKRWWGFVVAPLLLGAALSHHTPAPLAPLKIYLATTHIPQDKKWNRAYLDSIIARNFAIINKAIAKNYDIVVLPESAFPLFLNQNETLLQILKKLSKKIAIVTGALSFEHQQFYNATFVFSQGTMRILHKVVLVPFGEEIPLPKPLARLVNNIFFDGASDYTPAKEPQTYTIKGITFTNAICYEATSPIIYTTPSDYIIALSNNAWFIPSYEPILQNLIIRYYATINNKTVYHATNIAKTEIIR